MVTKKFDIEFSGRSITNYIYNGKRFTTTTHKFINYIHWLVNIGVDVTIFDKYEDMT